MPILRNLRHEHFAQLIATGKTPKESYTCVYPNAKGAHQSASRLLRVVSARVAELQALIANTAVTRAAIDREYVLAGLKANFERAMEKEEVRDAEGRVIGFQWNGAVANRALELMGKELGMFVERSQQVPWDGDFGKLTPEQQAVAIRQLELKVFGGDEKALAAAKAKALAEPDTVQ